MKAFLQIWYVFFALMPACGLSQVNTGNLSLSLVTGTINYQGDLNPNSFTFKNSNFSASVVLRKPLSRWLTWRGGAGFGKIQAADRNNRGYLRPRNLSFYSDVKEVHTGLEITFLDINTLHFTPYCYGGLALFHFNPWAYDQENHKVFLKPLSTEGQGIEGYPDRKPYALTQVALSFGAGIKYAITNCVNIGIEMSQRKTFTDYLDDVSTSFIDKYELYAARGAKAVELAYRGDELPGGSPYPSKGEQRGTWSEKDWYYFVGVMLEVRLGCLKNIVNLWVSGGKPRFQQKCPRFF